jgi:hypothetical protein
MSRWDGYLDEKGRNEWSGGHEGPLADQGGHEWPDDGRIKSVRRWQGGKARLELGCWRRREYPERVRASRIGVIFRLPLET